MYSIRVTDIVGGYTYKVLEPYDQDTYPVVSATLDEAVNAAMTLTFTIPSSHPNLADIKAAETTGGILVEAFRDGTQIFNGRVYKRTIDKMTGMHTFICESMFSRLNDSIVTPYHFAGTPADYFQLLFDNAAMGSYAGTVTVTDPNNYIVRSNEEPSVLWDEIADKCIGSSLGGFIECDANASQFSWLATPSASGTQKIRVAHNLLSCEDDFDVSERFTGVYVYGAELGTENEYGQKQYLDFNGVDISSELPSGFTQLYHSSVIWKDSLVSQFGMIYKMAHFDNVTTQSALISRAVSMLNNQSNITELRISAIDMSDIDGETDAITAGQTVEIVAPDGTISAMCTAISRDLLDPSNTTFEFGSPDNITSAASSEYGGGGASPTNFWHIYDDEYQQYYTGMSSLELDSILTSVASRYKSVQGGAVWLRYLPDVPSYTTNSYLMMRAYQLDAAFGVNSLFSSGTRWTMRAGAYNDSNMAELRLDDYSGDGYIKAPDPYFHAGNGTNQAQLHLTPTGDVGVRTSVDSGNTWSEMEYIHEGGSGGGGAGIELIIDERTSKTAQLVGTSVRSSGYLENGLRIAFYLKWDTADNTTLRFTGSDSVTTTSYVYDSGLRQLGAKYKAGSVLMLTYIKPLPYKNYPDTTVGVWVVDADASDYTLPTASATTLGGVKVGEHLSISDGVLAVETLTAQQVANLLTDD